MKRTIVCISLCFFLFACSNRSGEKQQAEALAGSPSGVLLGVFKAMSAEDSVTIINSLTAAAKERLLPQIEASGGFQTLFQTMKGMKYDTKILLVDTSSGVSAKIFVKQTFDQDSSVHLTMDSLYYSATKEDGVWKLLSLNAKKAGTIP